MAKVRGLQRNPGQGQQTMIPHTAWNAAAPSPQVTHGNSACV